MNRVITIISIMLSVLLLFSAEYATADGITPRADSEFASVTTTLKASKQVSFRALTNDLKTSISVTACWLEQKNNDGSWTTVCSLAAPSVVSQNDFSYSATMDYSSEIGTGTYRIRAAYNADGHTITRYSNERTFSN